MHKKYLIIPLLFLAASCKHKTVTNLHAPADSTTTDSVKTDSAKHKVITSAQLIIPGKGIGMTYVHEDMDTVAAKLGKPDNGDAAMGASFSTWYAKHDTAGYQTDIYAHRYVDGQNDNVSRVKIIRITSPWFKTALGVGAGQTLTDIGRHYPVKQTGIYSKGTDSLKVYDDISDGIAFEIDNSGKCTGVLVHAPHDSASGYLSMHPNMQYSIIKK